jgi:hypothetical protein
MDGGAADIDGPAELRLAAYFFKGTHDPAL